MSGVLRGILIGAGGALGVASQSENYSEFPRFLLRSALSGYDKISVKHSDSSSTSNQTNSSNEELQLLMKEIQELKLVNQSKSNKPIVVYGGSSSSGVIKFVIIGTTGVVVLYYFGYGFNDVMYVTKSTLSKAVKVLEDQVGFLGVKLQKTKEEIFVKIGEIESAIFSSSEKLEAQIDEEIGKVQNQISGLDVKFHEIQASQTEIKSSAARMDSHMAALEAKFDKNGMELQKANSGIKLLINSVMDLPHVQSNKSLMGDLRTFVSGYTSSWFGSRDNNKGEGETERKPIKAPGLYNLTTAKQ